MNRESSPLPKDNQLNSYKNQLPLHYLQQARKPKFLCVRFNFSSFLYLNVTLLTDGLTTTPVLKENHMAWLSVPSAG